MVIELWLCSTYVVVSLFLGSTLKNLEMKYSDVHNLLNWFR